MNRIDINIIKIKLPPVLITCCLILFLFSSPALQAQEKFGNHDSLLALTVEDTNRVNLLNEFAYESRTSDIPRATNYVTQALELAINLGFKKGQAEAYKNLGILYKDLANYEEALINNEKSRDIYQELGDIEGLATYYNNIGIIYSEMGRIVEAFKFHLRSYKIFKQLGNTEKIADLANNVGTKYFEMDNNDSALFYYNISLEINKELHNNDGIGNCYINIGEICEIEKRYDSAFYYYFQSLEILDNLNNNRGKINSNIYIGKLFNTLNRYQEAIPYLKNALDLAREEERKFKIKEAANSLHTSFSNLNLFDSTKYYWAVYRAMEDSLDEEVIKQKLTNLELKNEQRIIELESQEAREKLNRRNLYLIFSLIAFILVCWLALVIFRNYRIKNKANQLLAEIDEMKSRFFSNISHEFRTPLTLILGPLEKFLSQDDEKIAGRKEYLMMQRNAKRLLNLVNQLLDLSKLDSGNMKLEFLEGDIVKLLRIYVLSFSSMSDIRHINYSYEFPDENIKTWFDRDKLEKIMYNLISNAFKFTPENGKINIRVSRIPDDKNKPPKSIEIKISDSGEGIPEDQAELIYDRFQQADGRSYTDQAGSGIGLALTKELVNLHHGQISFVSEPGKGTTFTLILPLGLDPYKETEYILKEDKESVPDKGQDLSPDIEYSGEVADEGITEKETGQQNPLILVVDDSKDIRIHIRESLEDSFRIIEAENGRVGLEKTINSIPDLVISDLMMPEMDGIELCKNIKTDERISHIPVILLTAKASVEDKIEGLETGADDYITKPFNVKELLVRVKNLIDQRKNLRERFSKEISLEPKDIAVTTADEKFLQRIFDIVEKNISNTEFEVQAFSEEAGMSRMHLFRKLQALTDQTPSEFIRTIRLKRAAQLIEQNYGNVAQITYEVGFNNLSYFAKCFKQQFGSSPSEYASRFNKKNQ